MATVFETRLIGNIGKDAVVKNMDRGILAINFPVAHNKNWKDKKTNISKTKTTWVNCTIWKKEGNNLKIIDFLKKGSLVEVVGEPIAKAYNHEETGIRTEIRLNVSSINILRAAPHDEDASHQAYETGSFDRDVDGSSIEDFNFGDEDF